MSAEKVDISKLNVNDVWQDKEKNIYKVVEKTVVDGYLIVESESIETDDCS
jgi:hypothetical protein